MHVLLIHQTFATPESPGGTRHFEFGSHLVESGYTFTAITSHINYQTRERWQADDEQLPEGLKIRRTWSTAGVGNGFINRLLAFVSFMVSAVLTGVRVRHVDVVWGTSPPLFQAIGAFLVAKIRRVPFVLEIRDLWPDFAVVTGVLRNPLLIGVSRWIERFLYRHADLLIVNSPAYVDWVIERGAAPQRVELITNGVDVRSFDGADRESARKAMNIEDEFVVMYAGAHGLANHLDLVLDAAAKLRDRKEIMFVLVGDGRDKQALAERIESEDLQNVRMFSAVSKSEMPSRLAAADICIAALKPVPLFDKTYPNKVFDYMAASRPTVLAIDGVIRDVVENAFGGTYVAPKDAQGVADAVVMYAGDPELCRRQGESARKYVGEHFDRKDQSQQVEKLFQRALRDDVMTGLIGRTARRVLDLTGAILAILLLALPFMLIGIAIKIDSRGPVFFRQERVGHHGRVFRPWKFRTMVNNAESIGLGLNIEVGDSRITRVGRLLRAVSADELPQIFDVILGKMSLVGPRPTLQYQVDRYTDEQRRRLLARPGITGLAAINGRNAISWESRIKLDIQYIDSWSIWSYLRILLMTPWAAWISRKGIYGEDGINDDFGGTDS